MAKKGVPPLVSIIMPVRDEEAYVREALESILSQTYTHLELIVVDDGSTDDTPRILAKYAKKYSWMRVITHREPTGISIALNDGVAVATGEYLARMDADDISHPERIQRQITYLRAHPGVVAVGCQCDLIDGRGQSSGTKDFPLTHPQIYTMLMRYNPMMHPTIVIRRSQLPTELTLYDGPDGAEDLLLVFRLLPYGEVHNLPDRLYEYRIHGTNSSLSDIKHIFGQTLIARYRGIREYGYRPDWKGICSTIAQTALVYLLPESVTRYLYMTLRGMVARSEATEPAGALALSDVS